jgi:predicted ATPase
MLKRVYVDNFRCLVNFELKLDRVNLLLGGNGTGKTTVFEVLHRIRQFLSGTVKLNSVFPSKDITRWQETGLQRFELDLGVDEHTYTYSLALEHDEDRRRVRIKNEQLLFDTKALFEFDEGMARLYHDDFSPGPNQVPFDWTQSGLGSLQARPDNKKLTRFRREISRFVIARPCPTLMVSESRQDDDTLSPHMENFVSWYRHLSQEHQGAMVSLFSELKGVLPGFDSFSLKEVGEDTRALKVFFQRPGGGRKPLTYDFGELSEGQRMLIALYAIVFGLRDEGLHLFLDEPDNYVALREIQPWLSALTDSCGEGIEQAVLISHHPEIIDSLALSSGRWFDRDSNGPARVSDSPNAQVDGLKPSESVARGWES